MKDLKEVIGAVAAALTVVGAITFAAQHIAYERFYDAFGIAPEDVGIDSARVLSQSAAGIAGGLAVFLVPATAVLLLVSRRENRSVTEIVTVVGFVAVVASIFLFFQNAADADDAGRCAARPDGQSVRSIRFGIPFGPNITLLGVHADRAVINGTDPAKTPPWDGRQVIYLGTRDGATILFDPTAAEILRIPTGGVMVTIDTKGERFRKRRGCQAAAD